MMKRQKSLENYRGTKAEELKEVVAKKNAKDDSEVMSYVVVAAAPSTTTMLIDVRRLKPRRKFFASFSIEFISVVLLLMCSLLPSNFALNTFNSADHHHDVILSPNPQTKISSGKYAYFEPENASEAPSSRQMRRNEETATRVPWEEPLKETVSLALGRNSRVSKNAIFKATYTNYSDLDAPNFGDIAVLAKGKLKQHANKTFSFEQMNEKCDDKCQQNADKFLENVTALWMVERIRHRDGDEQQHRFDLKFTIIPINDNDEIKRQIDHNTLENRLRHQMKKSYVLRDSDYPRYFNNRRTDLFSRTGFTRTLSSLMNPANNMLQTLLSGFNISPLQQASLVHSNVVKSDAGKEMIIKDTRLNTGEFYIGMKPKITGSSPATTQKLNYHSSPSANVLAAAHGNAGNLQTILKFPESQEQHHQLFQQQQHYMQRGQQRPKPEIYHTNSPIDPRGAIDSIHVGSDNKNFHYHKAASPPALMTVPLYLDMNSIMRTLPAAAGAAFPLSLQFSTPTNPASLWIAQPEVTTFRYPQMVDHQHQPSLGAAKIPHLKNSSPGERHTAVYSRPDPVYHTSAPSAALKTEATASQSTRQNNYANVNSVVRLKSSHQLNKYDDNDDEFKPITPMYDVRRHKNGYRLAPTTSSPPTLPVKVVEPTSAQIIRTTISAERDNVILPTIIVESDEKSNEIAGYRVVSERATMTTTEKPVLKWMPKTRKTKPTNQTTFVVTPSALPTTIIDQIETTTMPPPSYPSPATTQLHHVTKTQFFRGKNRFSSKRNSSSLRAALTTISPAASAEPITTTKLIRKKSSTTHIPASSSLLSSSTVYPAYVTVTPIPMTDEVTLQSLSTSISFEVSGESSSDSSSSHQQTTSMPGYEVIPADVVEVLQAKSGNMQLFQVGGGASEVPDDLTISILNHAKTLEKNDSSSSASNNSSGDDDEDGLKKKV